MHRIAIETVRQAMLDAPQSGSALGELPDIKRRRAAVLCPLIERRDGPHVILTRRSMELPTHAGQISFPGGKIDAQDSSPLSAALREAEEEIGLIPEQVEILGLLNLYDTQTGFLVFPFVGVVDPRFRGIPEPREVDEIFEVPLGFLADPANHSSLMVKRSDRMQRVYEMVYRNYRIWGATAGMLRDLCERLWRDQESDQLTNTQA